MVANAPAELKTCGGLEMPEGLESLGFHVEEKRKRRGVMGG